MTEDRADRLVERLHQRADRGFGPTSNLLNRDGPEAAARIEALEATAAKAVEWADNIILDRGTIREDAKGFRQAVDDLRALLNGKD